MIVNGNVNWFAGEVGITLTIGWCEPKEDTEQHKAACERNQQFEVNVYTVAQCTEQSNLSHCSLSFVKISSE
jgi:hypothetical protein